MSASGQNFLLLLARHLLVQCLTILGVSVGGAMHRYNAAAVVGFYAPRGPKRDALIRLHGSV